jgi:hypothetical protein
MTRRIRSTICFLLLFGLISLVLMSCRQEKNNSTLSPEQSDTLVLSNLRIDSSIISFVLKNNLPDTIKMYTITQPKSNYNLLLYNFTGHRKSGWFITTPFRGPSDFDTIFIPPGNSNCFYLDARTNGIDTLLVSSRADIISKVSTSKPLHWCFLINNKSVSLVTPDSNSVFVLNKLDRTK